MTAPANRPIPNADNVFATAKGSPMMPAVMISMLGEVIGDEIQNAMTGASGRPRRRSAAMMGSAPWRGSGRAVQPRGSTCSPVSNSLSVLPGFKSKLREREFAAAETAGVDTLATIFHACHREICHYESGQSFEILNFMELVGESLGFRHEDVYKRLKLMQDIDAIVRDSEDLIARHGLDLEQVRDVIHADMLSGRSVGVSPVAGVTKA